jgi:hypothetical protein
MERIAGEGDAIYRNPRAVPRAFVVSRYRCFGSREEMLRWLPTPLFAPRDTVLLDCGDAQRLPPGFRADAWRDDEGIAVTCTHWRTAGDKAAEAIDDEALRFRTALFQAPWGWSEGDEISLRLEPGEAGYQYFALFKYLPDSGAPCRLTVHLESSAESRAIEVELPGGSAGLEGEKWLRAGAALGALDRQPYQLSLRRTEECSARLDSLRIARSLPDPDSEEAGTVEIASFEPNRIRLRAELKRASFVVLSETYYPGWEAEIDGKPAPLLKGDYILRAVPVPAGVHDVVLRFRPGAFRSGLVVSLFGLAALVFILLRK